MAELSLFWDGEVLGDCGPYDQSDLMDTFFRALLNGTGDQGVLRYWLDELEVSGTTSPVTVSTGAAIIYGMFFQNDEPVSVTIPTPTTGPRGDWIVVRRNWATQECRIGRIAGPGAALTQAPGAVYDVPLFYVTIDVSGNIVLTDWRDYVTYSTDWPANAVDTEHFMEGAVTVGDVPDRTRWELKDSGSIMPDSANPCAWVAGAAYDYWEYSDAATDTGWVYFMCPTGVIGNAVILYTWSVPDVNGGGGAPENCEWDYTVYYGPSGGVLNTTAATTTVDQAARVNTTVYRDQLVDLTALSLNAGDIIILQLDRDGAGDSYNSAMRLIGVEMAWTADS